MQEPQPAATQVTSIPQWSQLQERLLCSHGHRRAAPIAVQVFFAPSWTAAVVVVLAVSFLLVAGPTVPVTAATFKITAVLPLTDSGSSSVAAGIQDALLAAQGIIDQAVQGSNHTVALNIKDSAGNLTVATKEVFDAAHDGAVAIIGEVGSSVTIPLALATTNLGLWTCSGSATAPDLAATKGFPFFFRTISSDVEQGRFLARFVRLMQWHSVAVLYCSDAYGLGLSSVFREEADAQNVQIAAMQSHSSMDRNGYTPALTAIKDSGTRIIIFFGLATDLIDIARHGRDLDMIGNGYVWIGADGISDLPDVLATSGKPSDVENCNGVLFSVPDQQGGAQYPSFWSTFHAAYPKHADMPPYATLFVDCYQALARSLVRLAAKYGADTVLKRAYPAGITVGDFVVPFEGVSGPVAIGADSNRVADFVIQNMWSGRVATVYTYPPGATALKSTSTAVRFYDGTSNVPSDRPEQHEGYVRWTSAGGIGIAAVTAVLIAVVVVMMGYLFLRRTHPGVRSLSFVFLVQIAVGVVLVLASVLVSIGVPTTLTCNLHSWCLLMGLVLVLSAIAAKSYRVWRVFDLSHRVEKLHRLSDTWLLLACLAIALGQALILTLSTVLAPLEPVLISLVTSVSYKCTAGKSTWSILSQALLLVYNLALFVSVLYLAFKTRKAFSAFKETTYIGYACQNMFICAAIIVPLRYHAPDSIALTAYIIRTVLLLYASLFTFLLLVARIALVPFLAKRQSVLDMQQMWGNAPWPWSSSDAAALVSAAADTRVGFPTTMQGKYAVRKGNSIFAPWRTHRLTLFALEGWLALSRVTKDTECGKLFKLRTVAFDPNPAAVGESTTCIELRVDSTSYLVECTSMTDKARWVRALATHCPMYTRSGKGSANTDATACALAPLIVEDPVVAAAEVSGGGDVARTLAALGVPVGASGLVQLRVQEEMLLMGAATPRSVGSNPVESGRRGSTATTTAAATSSAASSGRSDGKPAWRPQVEGLVPADQAGKRECGPFKT
ncbi:hypothetical protein AMAG_14283 [Allomyces macrogynus ATCC 38327]|uniref:G-protein coupled receptors family 3 profile domain-containing protein n=1 Tax=Allomyces macrogynus (strain ATCC 38327) TaxID=578462 RepID=A0A0L0T4S5_ALLM3|nr:hypothetical protein AMAG_14283 [Allomyces macrogynus ATCC 38327]|eukprot:KNE69742.1 hypothetical protein AMAG_14283 [Allomyces macrogynus ATCC 38327]